LGAFFNYEIFERRPFYPMFMPAPLNLYHICAGAGVINFFVLKKEKKMKLLLSLIPPSVKPSKKYPRRSKKAIDNNVFLLLYCYQLWVRLVKFKMRINTTYQNITIIIRATGIILLPLLSLLVIRSKLPGLII